MREDTFEVESFDSAPYVPDASGTIKAECAYSRAALPERVNLYRYLVEHHDAGPTERLLTLLGCWKQTSHPRYETQTYEWLVKEAFSVEADIRTADDTVCGEPPTRKEREVLETHCTVSRQLLERRFGEAVPVHRGVRKRAVAELFAQALDAPSRSYYYLGTSVVSNHSTLARVGTDYSDGVVLRWEVDPASVVAAVDHLRIGEIPNEAELHLAGGVMELPAACVKHAGLGSQTERPIAETSDLMQYSGGMGPSEHRAVADLVAHLGEQGVSVGTREGANRLRNWWADARESGAFTEKQVEAIGVGVESAADPDTDAYWLEGE